MRITKATEENSHLPKGMNGSYVSKQNENRAGETKKKQRQMDRKLNGLLWRCGTWFTVGPRTCRMTRDYSGDLSLSMPDLVRIISKKMEKTHKAAFWF